jgi:uncharacterized protein (TIGR03437 family)
MRRWASVCLVLASLTGTEAGAQPSVSWSGYTRPGPITVAPGQILTLFVAGIKASFTSPVVAASLPLPVSLSGISVTIRSPSQSYEAPIFSIAPMDPCTSGQTGGPGCPVTAITIQVPFEISSPNGTTVFPPLTLSIAEDGVSGPSYPLNAQADNIHILTTCDVVVSLSASPSGGCRPLVVHSNGALVTGNSNAEPGEIVSIYATGLGSTYPIVASGAPSPAPPAVAGGMGSLNGVYGVNLGPAPSFTRCQSCFPPSYTGPDFVGLAPGYVGLYQINFQIPPAPLEKILCGTDFQVVLSNFTITISGFDSFDGAGLCVDTSSHS